MRSPIRTSLALACLALLPAYTLAWGQTSPASAQRVTFTLRYDVTAKSGTTKVTLTAVVPRSLPGKQRILRIDYSPKPTRVFDRHGNRYARFVLNRPKRETTVTVRVEAEIYRRDFATASARRNTLSPKKKDLARWLAHEKYLEKNAPAVRQAARGLAGKTDEQTVRNVMKFVAKTLRQGPFDGNDNGATWALRQKRGDCTEFADLFVALCRANGVPARWWQGYLVTPPAKNDTSKHDRAEVYLRKYGWVPIDPFHVFLGGATFEELQPTYVYFDVTRRNPALDNFHYYSYAYEGAGASVSDSFLVRRREAAQSR
jgi:transglutaminase-like putative cysteine protease